MAGLAGVMPGHYRRFAGDAMRALDAASSTDTRLGAAARQGGRADAAGWDRSGAVLTGARSDTAALAPVSGTAAGQRALINALRVRLAQQQHLIRIYQTRDTRLAALLGSLAYPGRAAAGTRMPLAAMPFPSAGSALSSMAGLGGAGGRTPHAALVDWPGGAGRLPAEPGEGAAKAALSRLGCPYVWGAKGPNRFDCSGLTQWAWRQAGVQLGSDTYAQLSDGVPVPAGQVRAGDLIFPLDAFGEGGRRGPGHVQLAISDHQVVHAPTSGDVVRITALPAHYLARRPVRPALT